MKYFYLFFSLLFASISYSQAPCPGLDSINYSGQWYHTVQIGSQCWLKENLNVGIMKPAIKDQTNNDTIEKFCYNNDSNNCNVYGGLYQWRETMQYSQKIGARGICPIGWHVPLSSEFDSLISMVHEDGNTLKEIGQGGGTNMSGFSGLLSGLSKFSSFSNLGNGSYFWSDSMVHIDVIGRSLILYADNLDLESDNLIKRGANFYDGVQGLSVRCVKDNIGLLLQSPYGGESWQVGSIHSISWGGNNLPNTKIKIEYSTDNGISWLQIIDSVPALDGNYNWIVPNTLSKNCKVRITDLNNPTSFSISDNVFTIYITCPGGSTIEHGGQIYNTVLIGNQCWLKENLNIGKMIPGVQEAYLNGIIEKYCYNDDTANCTIYGGLYKYTEMQEQGICPTFWHISGLSSLANNVSYDANVLKAKGQGSGFGEGTNASGFSALLAGLRNMNDGTFSYLGIYGWFLKGHSDNFVYNDYLESSDSYLFESEEFGNDGGSLRCVRDDVGPLLLKSPVGGENWQIGSNQKIIWTLSEVINIRIDYTTDNGTSWINIISSTPTSTGSYNWTIPNTPSINCKVRISSANNPDTNSISNTFRIYQVSTNPCPGIPTINYGGQTYNTIAIGDQCWLKENLNIGTMINGIQNDSDNGIIEKYCYNNDTAYCSAYGGLYQWSEAMQYSTTEGTRGICPTGWHIPGSGDFSILKATVGYNSNDLKELGQGSGSGAGTNASGFSGLLAGAISRGSFISLGIVAPYWSSKIYDSTLVFYFGLFATDSVIDGGPVPSAGGESIRCINDLTVSELPVELTTFTDIIIRNNVIVNWSTATEINTSSFNIEKKLQTSNSWQQIASIKASCNSTSPKQYSYTDKYVNTGKYNYRLKMVDLDGSSKYSNIITAEVTPPAKYDLFNAYPNPCNPTTTIRYQVPVNILVTIKIFDALGKEVFTLVNEVKSAGSYEVTLNGKNLSSGVYYYQMKAGKFVDAKKFLLIK